MIRSMLFAAIAAALVIPSTVEAASMHRYRHHGAYHARVWNNAPVGLYGGYADYGYGYRAPWRWNAYTNGPRWASPNQCFVDLGYGRYESCDR